MFESRKRMRRRKVVKKVIEIRNVIIRCIEIVYPAETLLVKRSLPPKLLEGVN